MSSFKSSENIQKKEGVPDRSVSDNQSSSNSTFRHGALKSYGFPTSKAEEQILIGPQLCYGVDNQSAVEFPYNQHLKIACNDIISSWGFVNGWKSDF